MLGKRNLKRFLLVAAALLLVFVLALLVLHFSQKASNKDSGFKLPENCTYSLDVKEQDTDYAEDALEAAAPSPINGFDQLKLVANYIDLPDPENPMTKENFMYLFTHKIRVFLSSSARVCVNEIYSDSNSTTYQVSFIHFYCTNGKCYEQHSKFKLIFNRIAKEIYAN